MPSQQMATINMATINNETINMETINMETINLSPTFSKPKNTITISQRIPEKTQPANGTSAHGIQSASMTDAYATLVESSIRRQGDDSEKSRSIFTGDKYGRNNSH